MHLFRLLAVHEQVAAVGAYPDVAVPVHAQIGGVVDAVFAAAGGKVEVHNFFPDGVPHGEAQRAGQPNAMLQVLEHFRDNLVGVDMTDGPAANLPEFIAVIAEKAVPGTEPHQSLVVLDDVENGVAREALVYGDMPEFYGFTGTFDGYGLYRVGDGRIWPAVVLAVSLQPAHGSQQQDELYSEVHLDSCFYLQK